MSNEPAIIEQHPAPRLAPLVMAQIVWFGRVISAEDFSDHPCLAGQAKQDLRFGNECGALYLWERILPYYVGPIDIELLTAQFAVKYKVADQCIIFVF